jgi:hypothetical protein
MATSHQQQALEALLSALAGQQQLLLRLIAFDPACPELVEQLRLCQRAIGDVSVALVVLSRSPAPIESP